MSERALARWDDDPYDVDVVGEWRCANCGRPSGRYGHTDPPDVPGGGRGPFTCEGDDDG